MTSRQQIVPGIGDDVSGSANSDNNYDVDNSVQKDGVGEIESRSGSSVDIGADDVDVDWKTQSSGPRCGCNDACLNVAIPFIGNVLEWFDFAVFGYLTSVLSEAFFPPDDPIAATMETFSIFAGAFLMRPVGGLIFGHIGDTIGRKRALLTSIILMAVATTSMACLPTYAQVGPAAPILLTLVRLLQGISIGGQLVGTFVHAVETAPKGQKMLRGAYTYAGVSLGMCLGSAVAAVLKSTLTNEQLVVWGWRIPFGMGLFVGVFTVAFRHRIHEPVVVKTSIKNPIKEAFGKHTCLMIKLMIVIGFFCSNFYFIVVWIVTFSDSLRFPSVPQPYTINTVLTLVHIACFHFFGKCADKHKGPNHSFIVWGAVAIGLTLMPMMVVLDLWDIGSDPCANITNATGIEYEGLANMSIGNFTECVPDTSHDWQLVLIAVCCQGWLLIALTVAATAIPTWVVSQFRSEIRYSAVGISYNFSQALFGGTTPLIATALFDAGVDPDCNVTMAQTTGCQPNKAYIAALMSTVLAFAAIIVLYLPRMAAAAGCPGACPEGETNSNKRHKDDDSSEDSGAGFHPGSTASVEMLEAR